MMNNDQLNKYDRLSTHILRKNIKKFRTLSTRIILVLLIVIAFQFGVGTIHAISNTIIVAPQVETGIKEVKYYALYEKDSKEYWRAYCNQMLDTIYECE